MKTKLISLFFILGIMACTPQSEQSSEPEISETKLDLQGHRGCRGLMPENSIPGFLHALDLGVTTLEMDIVVSKDSLLVLSHEPFFSHEIAITPHGHEISEAEEKTFNLFQMNYEEIKQYDCGSRPHTRFPDQQKFFTYKPLLSEVIDSVERYVQQKNLAPVFYNIETKSTPEGDQVFHPDPETFVDLMYSVLKEKNILERSILQSFDVRTLQVAHRKYPDMVLALLVEDTEDISQEIADLGFTPEIFSPYFKLLSATSVAELQAKKIRVIPWTVNDPDEILSVLEMGVDGIISDYPDRVNKILNR